MAAPEVRVLLTATSPYGGRAIAVETDGVTTSARLHTPSGETIAQTWLANHGPAPAPPPADQTPAESTPAVNGRVPPMPAPHTAHPEGRAEPDPAALEIVWTEEGDTAAVLENGRPLCVIPPWCDRESGEPGYSRDARGRTPYAWSLTDAMAELGPRVERARTFWHAEGPPVHRSVLAHLTGRLGAQGYYWPDVAPPTPPLVGVSERPGDGGPAVLSTVGMSGQRMPTVELYEEDLAGHARVELAVATTLPSPRAASVFGWLGAYPWRVVTAFADGDTVKWYHDPSTFPLGPDGGGVLLLADPASLGGPPPPDLSGLTVAGDPVRWLWLVPITEEERQFAKAHGHGPLVDRLANDGRSWVVT
jgi:hypothetical protein